MFRSLNTSALWAVTLSAAGILMVTMGARQSLGLFLAPLDASTGLGIASISLAMAVGQFMWGAVQPIAGAVADRYGPGRMLQGGLVLLALGSAMTPFMNNTWGLVISLGLLSAIGSGAGSFSVLIGAATTRLPIEARGAASGVINAGGSFGQFIFAPVLQKLIQVTGWMGAMWSLAAIVLAALQLVRVVSCPVADAHRAVTGAADPGLRQSVRQALGDHSYLLLHAGFFTCGFHIAFLVTHLPGEVNLCGLPPLCGQLVAGHHRPSQHLRQPLRRRLRRALSQQACAVLDVRVARGDDRALPDLAAHRSDLLPVCRRPRPSSASCSTCAISGRCSG